MRCNGLEDVQCTTSGHIRDIHQKTLSVSVGLSLGIRRRTDHVDNTGNASYSEATFAENNTVDGSLERRAVFHHDSAKSTFLGLDCPLCEYLGHGHNKEMVLTVADIGIIVDGKLSNTMVGELHRLTQGARLLVTSDIGGSRNRCVCSLIR